MVIQHLPLISCLANIWQVTDVYWFSCFFIIALNKYTHRPGNFSGNNLCLSLFFYKISSKARSCLSYDE